MTTNQQVMGIKGLGYESIATEKAAHSQSVYTSTYSPYLGMVLKGDHSNTKFRPGDDMFFANQALAIGKVQTKEAGAHYASKHDPKSDYKRQIFDFASSVEFDFTASLKKQLWMEAQTKKAQRDFIANGGQIGAGQGLPPYIAAQMYNNQMSPYQASVPPGGNDSAAQVVGPLTQIPFIQDVLGFPTPEYHINELTTKVALPQLHAEQPETDWGTPNLQLEPTQFVENRRPDFDSHFFLAKRNEFAFIIPREYRYRATIDPYNIYTRQAADGLRQAREALTLLALSGLPDGNGEGFDVFGGVDIPDPTVDSGGVYPAAENNAKAFYESAFANFWKSTRGMIDSIVMNPLDFVQYESNFYTNGWQGYLDVSDWGIIQMPGFKRRIRVATSPFCPANQIYFFNSRFVFTGEGPMVTETWAKPEANSDAGAYRDYVDVRIFNSFRAGFKGKIDGSSPVEITNIDEARQLIVPPTNLLEKNRS